MLEASARVADGLALRLGLVVAAAFPDGGPWPSLFARLGVVASAVPDEGGWIVPPPEPAGAAGRPGG